MVFLVHHLRILRRNNHRSLNLPVAHVFPCLYFVLVRNRHERARRGPHRIKSLLDPDRLRTVIFIHDPHLGVANFAPERVPQHEELHQREDHGHHHQGR